MQDHPRNNETNGVSDVSRDGISRLSLCAGVCKQGRVGQVRCVRMGRTDRRERQVAPGTGSRGRSETSVGAVPSVLPWPDLCR